MKCTSALAVTLTLKMTCLPKAELRPILPLNVPESAPGIEGRGRFSADENERIEEAEDPL